jgi:hypothetical protein
MHHRGNSTQFIKEILNAATKPMDLSLAPADHHAGRLPADPAGHAGRK